MTTTSTTCTSSLPSIKLPLLSESQLAEPFNLKQSSCAVVCVEACRAVLAGPGRAVPCRAMPCCAVLCCAVLCCAVLTVLLCCAGLCCCKWFLRRRANKKQLAYVDQYYNTVGYNQPAVDYAATGAAAGSLGSLTQNLKSDSMSSSRDLESMASTNPIFNDSAAIGTGAAAAAAAPGLMRTYSNASSEPRGPNPGAGWLNKDLNASNPLYQGDSTRAASAERPARRGRLPTDASPLTGMTTQPNRMRGWVGVPDRTILDS